MKNLLIATFCFLASSISSASLQTIPTEFTVRCGIAEDLQTLKISKNLSSVYACTPGRPHNPDSYGSTVTGEGKVSISIGANVFPETSLYTLGMPDQPKYQVYEESCENIKALTLIVTDSKIESEYGLNINNDEVTISQDGVVICTGIKK